MSDAQALLFSLGVFLFVYGALQFFFGRGRK